MPASNSGPRARILPEGPATTDPPANAFPPSKPTSCATATYIPCSEAESAARRSHRSRLAGASGLSSPRAGVALTTSSSCAPSSAASVGISECQASSQTSMAARPHAVSNARTSAPASTNRSSSNTP